MSHILHHGTPATTEFALWAEPFTHLDDSSSLPTDEAVPTRRTHSASSRLVPTLAERQLFDLLVVPPALQHLRQHACLPSSVLLYGPPGNGKSALVRRVAAAAGLAFLELTPSALMSQWVGQTEKTLRKVFELARNTAPSLLFFDEADSIFSARGQSSESEVMRRVKTEALLLLQDVLNQRELGVTVVVATNLPWDLDSAILRRLEERLYVGLPTVHERTAIARSLLDDDHVIVAPPEAAESEKSVHPLEQFAESLDGCSCAEVAIACRAARRLAWIRIARTQATHLAASNGKMTITQLDLTTAAQSQPRTVLPEVVRKFLHWR